MTESLKKKYFEILKSQFKHSQFRGQQEKVIENLLKGKNALVIMPTGYGKSLCYQLPSQIFEGLSLVISPLISLMEDQVEKGRALGLNCSFINSSLSSKKRDSRYQSLAQKKWKLLYVTPERFRKKEFLEALKKNTISLMAIDEAHCISEWGHDFRPDYSLLGRIRKNLKNPPTLALTATATLETQKDILHELHLEPQNTEVFIDGIERPNLSIQVLEVYGEEEKWKNILSILKKKKLDEVILIYFSLISTLKKISRKLEELNLKFLTYHGSMREKERRQSQKEFIESSSSLLLATPAFGLGINKPDIRQIIHAEIPSSIEAYYQEIGRAGRDGKPALCTLLFDEDDLSIQMDFIKWANPSLNFILSVFNLISEHPEDLKAKGTSYLRDQMNFYNRRDFRSETALNLLERWGCIKIKKRESESLDIEILEKPSKELLKKYDHSKKLKQQNKKLLEMLRYGRAKNHHKQIIYHYFGV